MAKKKALSKGQAKPKQEAAEPRKNPVAKDRAADRRPRGPQADASAPTEHRLPPDGPVIVGIGSSAGGLNAVGELLRHLPADTNLAFVVVQHLDPHHESAMAELLARETKMPVRELADGTRPQPNHVYIIAPNRSLVFQEGLLQLQPRGDGPGYYMPIDRFFHSLADAQKSRSIGIVLSGGGTDGVLGLQAIKAEGGITFAQDESAVHGGMPRSAVAAGCVDFILPPAKIAEELIRISRHDYLNHTQGDGAPVPPETQDGLQSVIRYLQKTRGIEFEHYKQPTLRRRIERRMVLRQFNNLHEYLDLLRQDRNEVDALCQDIFIHVTSFFRDAEVLGCLKTSAFPRIVKGRSVDSPIRIWVPGCSSGEEVYTLAILLLEYLDEIGDRIPIKIFATDIAEAAIARARSGVYLENVLADVSPERLKKFFAKRDQGYEIAKSIRDMCVFARHDVTKDPPFSQLDLISCRNVLIYLGPMLQQRVFYAFHYALKPGGILLLGNSESVGGFTEMFEPVDPHARIYAAKPGPRRPAVDFSSGTLRPLPVGGREFLGPAAIARVDVQKEADRVILAKYAPAGVVVDDANQVVQFRGHTGRFLEHAPGQPSLDVLKMAREGLLVDLRRGLDLAREKNAPVRREQVRVKTNDHFSTINLEILPVAAPTTGPRHFIVMFEESEPRPKPPASAAPPPRKRRPKTTSAADPEVAQLREELAAAKTYLQSIVEQYEASNEEMKAANEEIISSNEELQSTSEELETAKEELQATNEELSTINDELQSRVATGAQLNDDLTNLIDSVNIPIVILDREMRLRRFTPAGDRLLNLIPTDVGRPINDIRPRIEIQDWKPLVREVQETLAVKQREVRDDAGRWYSMTIRPYQTQEKKIGGTIITLVDIDTLKVKEREIIAARDYAANIVNTSPTPMLVLDKDFRVLTANRSFSESYPIDASGANGQHLFGLGEGEWNFPRLRELLGELRDRGTEFDNVEACLDFARAGRRILLLTGRAISPAHDRIPEFILLAIEDITNRRRAEAMQDLQHRSLQVLTNAEGLNEARGKLLEILADSLDFEFGQVWEIDESQVALTCSDFYCRGKTGSGEFESYSRSARLPQGEDFAGKVWQQRTPLWVAEETKEEFAAGSRGLAWLEFRSAVGFPVVWRDQICAVFTLYSRYFREASEIELREIGDLSSQIAEFLERSHAKRALLESEARLRAIFQSAAEGIITVDEQGAIESVNPAVEAMFGYSAAELIGSDISRLIPLPLGQSSAPAPLPERLKRLIRDNAEGLGRRQDESTFPILITIGQIPLGQKMLFAAIIHDISALKEIEARVIQAERLAVIGELSAGLAHESRNALQRSQSCLEMLMHEIRGQPKALDLVDRIQKAQDYLLQLYEGVRDYAAPIHLERARTDLVELAQRVWDDLEAARQNPSARLIFDRDATDVHCYVDPLRMGQVFRNLFENALAACGSDCEVTVSFVGTELDGRQALTTAVQDNGPGIPKDQQERIFQPFFTTKTRGSGLGLAICKRIVEAHGGRIAVHSAAARGAGIEITLPRPPKLTSSPI